MKSLKISLLFLLVAICLATVVSASNMEIDYVRINGETLDSANGTTHENNLLVERGDELEIRVCIKALAASQDVVVTADIFGYRHALKDSSSRLSDQTNPRNYGSGDIKCEELTLKIPVGMDFDYYKVRIAVVDRDTESIPAWYQLNIEGIAQENAVIIKDYSITPTEIIAGRSATALVRVKNVGDYDLEDLKLTVSIPDLEIYKPDYMNDLEADDSKMFEEVPLKIPECTKPGTYDVVISVEFDEYETVEETTQIKVIESQTCGNTNPTLPNTIERSIITVPNAQEVLQGASVVYPIMINNVAGNAKIYTISVSGTSGFATTRIDPGNVMSINAGQSKTVYLSLSVYDTAELGDKAFTITVESDGESKQIPITARITQPANAKPSSTNFRTGLEIALIILVVILIVIALIFGFKKAKENKSEPYY